MNVIDVIKNISRYLKSSMSTPIIVDVPDESSVMAFQSDLELGHLKYVDVSQYCKKDSLPQLDKLINDITSDGTETILLGLSTLLKLKGKEYLMQTLNSLLGLSIQGKLIIVTYQCKPYLNFKDPRLKAKGAVSICDYIDTVNLPTLYFISPNLANDFDCCADGINKITLLEQMGRDTLYVVTNKKKTDFPDSLYDIREYSSTYNLVVKTVNELSTFPESFGTEGQWNYLYHMMQKYEDWIDMVEKEFGGKNNIAYFLPNLKSSTSEKAWLYFIVAKVYGCPGNEYFSRVIAKATSLSNMYECFYFSILDVDCSSKAFINLYNERKNLLKQIKIDSSIITDYCKLLSQKDDKAIFYLTDLTPQEKEKIIEILSGMFGEVRTEEIVQILKVVYPALATYLTNFNYGNDLLTEYFNKYKLYKVLNRIPTDFLEVVNQQAKDRDYNSILLPRASVLAKKDINKSLAYFVDALGVEFLSYIQDKCYSLNLTCDISVARCNLPSITCMNKEFVETFTNKGCIVRDVKELDSNKHDGIGKYNYEQTKAPIHIIKELEIIDNIMIHVKEDLEQGDIDKVFLMSDHGASRLAVINESENKWEVSEKGLHSGRCCPKCDLDEKPDFATEENDYWCLANYDRFKGGRKASVEVHGGASLEEVAVPIVEIKKAGDKPKCEIIQEYKTITVSFKKKARIQLFIAKNLDDVQVKLNGKTYKATATEQKYIYDVYMPDVKKGSYSIDVYSGSNIIAQGLTFEAKSAGATENKFF